MFSTWYPATRAAAIDAPHTKPGSIGSAAGFASSSISMTRSGIISTSGCDSLSTWINAA